MDLSQFDKYSRYLIAAAFGTALLTYWRFQDIDLPAVYSYVAQQNVMHAQLFHNLSSARSVVWDFFGLLNSMLVPHSIILLKIIGLFLIMLNLFLISRLLDYMLGQRFWGFLCVLLTALSPFSVVSAVSGGPAAAGCLIVILYLMSLYKNNYIVAGILSGIALASNLPGLIFFLITILDLLQNSKDKKKIVPGVLSSTAGFLGVVVLVFIYSAFSGTTKIFSIPIVEHDVSWRFVAVVPLVIANLLNIAGIVYLVIQRRYDVYKTHFHTLMLWITSCAMCVVQFSTTNLLVSLVVSSILALFFLQGFISLWNFKPVSAETFAFLFVAVFLFADLYANSSYVRDILITECNEKVDAVDRVIDAITSVKGDPELVTNFVPAELSVKLGKPVLAIDADLLPMGEAGVSATQKIFVVDKISKTDSLPTGCRELVRTGYTEEERNHVVQVIYCEGNK